MSTGSQIARRAIDKQSVFPRRTVGQRIPDVLFRLAMYAALGVALVTLAALFYDFISDGAGEITPQFFTNQPSKINPASSGLQSALVGTLWLMALCALIVVPLGVATAVYLEEYADNNRWYNRMIEVNIQNLASVPSVVYGILGLAFIVRGPLSIGPIVIAGAITLALLVLPVVIIVAREAIRAVPPSIREGSLALGATKWQTIWKQVLPGAIAGIATGVILALSRAVGETAPLLILGAAISPRFNPGPTDTVTALPLQIFNWSRDSDTVHFLPKAAGAIIVLMTVLLLMNSAAIYLRNRFEQKW